MQFTTFLSLFGAAALAAANNNVTFVSLDDTDRTIHFTPNDGCEDVESVEVKAGETASTEIPESWIGNFYAISEGADDKPGMLGEVAFQGWNGLTYFDVSAIIDPNDHDGVKEMWPLDSESPTSGCEKFPCDNAYYIWDDVQTKVTSETTIMCSLGEGQSLLKKKDNMPDVVKRNYVLGKF